MKFNGYVCDKCGKLVAMDKGNPEKTEISMFVSTDDGNANIKLKPLFRQAKAESVSTNVYGGRLRLSKDLCYDCTVELFAWLGMPTEEPKKEEEPKKTSYVKPQAYPWTPNGGNRVPNGTLANKYAEPVRTRVEPSITADWCDKPKEEKTEEKNECLVSDFLEDILLRYYPDDNTGAHKNQNKRKRTVLLNWANKNFKYLEDIMKCKRVEDTTDYSRPMGNQWLYDLKQILAKEGFKTA